MEDSGGGPDREYRRGALSGVRCRRWNHAVRLDRTREVRTKHAPRLGAFVPGHGFLNFDAVHRAQERCRQILGLIPALGSTMSIDDFGK